MVEISLIFPHENQVFTSQNPVKFKGPNDDRGNGRTSHFFWTGPHGLPGKRVPKILGKHGKTHGLLPPKKSGVAPFSHQHCN